MVQMPRNTSAANQKRFNALVAEFQVAAAENHSPSEKLLIQRIAESDEAAAIFAKVKDDNTVMRLLSLCVEGHDLATNFHKLVADARRKLKKGPAYGRAIATVMQLLNEAQAPPLTRLDAYTQPDPKRIAAEHTAVVSILDRLRDQNLIAEETIRRVGTTRKSRGITAAHLAAIGWIAEGVRRITKRTNGPLTADVAELVLGEPVSLDRVKKAAKTRKREWRV